MKVIDCTFDEFLTLPEETVKDYMAIGLVMKTFDYGESTTWEWGKVKEIQFIFTTEEGLNAILKSVAIMDESKPEWVRKRSWIETLKKFNAIVKGLEIISEKEKMLEYEPTIYELEAGIEDYGQFGYFVTIDRLSGGDPLKYERVTKLPWNVIFSKLMLDRTDSDFRERYQKIMQRKYSMK